MKQKQEIETRKLTEKLFPRALSVTELVDARHFEIQAMEAALKNANQFTGLQQIHQTIPRHLRRRQASNNVKRLPVKYRAQAADRTISPSVKKSKRKHHRNPQRIFLQRTDWLETHIWHSKRMKMVDKWGMKLALENNQKSQRFVYKSLQNDCVMYDASYYSCLLVEGNFKLLKRVFDEISDPTMESMTSNRYVFGNVHGSMFLHEALEYPSACVSQISFHWEISDLDWKKVWIWVHPDTLKAVYRLLWKQLSGQEQELVNDTIQSISTDTWRLSSLRGEFNKFEIAGACSTLLLTSSLTIANSKTSEECAMFWESLKARGGNPQLVAGTMVNIVIEDPRVCFPRFMDKDLKGGDASFELPESVPFGVPSGLLDAELCRATISNRATDKSLEQRRSSSIVPGTLLEPLDSDPKIPILLIYRGILEGGWEVIAPKGWGLSLWRLFTYAGARAIGLQGRQRLHFETGLPCYPHDFPETFTGAMELKEIGKHMKDKHKRTPTGKRPNFELIGNEHPFIPGFLESAYLNSVERLTIIHSIALANILNDCFKSRLENYVKFKAVAIERIHSLLKDRDVLSQLGGLKAADNIDDWHCRVELEIFKGRVEPNSLIYYIGDEKENTLVYIN